MLLTIERDKSTAKSTPGILKIDGYLHCFTLEDVVRVGADGIMQKEEKVYGRTAIPAGKYKVTLEPFRGDKNKMYPYLHDVPYFTGIFVHGGNTDEDSLGCVLVGNHRAIDRIWDSYAALSGLCHRVDVAIANKGEVWIEIRDFKPSESKTV